MTYVLMSNAEKLIGRRSEAQHGVWSGDGPVGLYIGANVNFHMSCRRLREFDPRIA
jgi:hypothetical protein